MSLSIAGSGFVRNGAPFRLIADTAWRVAYKSSREEVDRYLADRSQRGFNAVLTAAVMERRLPSNRYGDAPYRDERLALDAGYWGHIDYIVDEANDHGLLVGLVPLWGVEVGSLLDASTAAPHGEELGRRYRNADVFWLLGGDIQDPRGREATWAALAAGLQIGGSGGLITYHSTPGFEGFPECEWQQFTSIQTGHTRRAPIEARVQSAAAAGKPVVVIEPAYEDLLPSWQPREARIDAGTVARQAQEARDAGAAGIGYGHNAIWFWNLDGREDGTHIPTGQDQQWWEGLGAPGADRVIRAWADPG